MGIIVMAHGCIGYRTCTRVGNDVCWSMAGIFLSGVSSTTCISVILTFTGVLNALLNLTISRFITNTGVIFTLNRAVQDRISVWQYYSSNFQLNVSFVKMKKSVFSSWIPSVAVSKLYNLHTATCSFWLRIRHYNSIPLTLFQNYTLYLVCFVQTDYNRKVNTNQLP